MIARFIVHHPEWGISELCHLTFGRGVPTRWTVDRVINVETDVVWC